MSNKETAQEIFNTSVEAGHSRDIVIVEMVKGGVSLNTAQNLYKEFAEEAGITSTRVGHKAEAIAHLEEIAVDVTDNEVRAKTRDALVEMFKVAKSTATDYIKAYADKHSIELPRSSFGSSPEDQAKIFDFIVANINCEKKEFAAFMRDEMGRSAGSIDETYRGIILARKLADAGVFA